MLFLVIIRDSYIVHSIYNPHFKIRFHSPCPAVETARIAAKNFGSTLRSSFKIFTLFA